MKTKQLFWGFIFITIGFLSLSIKYDWVYINFDMLTDLWPVIFILGGIMVIAKDSKLRPLIAILFGIVTAVIVFSFAYTAYPHEDDWDKEFMDSDTELSYEYNDQYKFADLTINGGVGEFLISGTTEELYEASPNGIFQLYEVEVDKEDNTARINFDLGDNVNFDTEVKNKLHLKLNEEPVWSFELNLGAANSMFNLEDFKVKKIDLSTGATNTVIKLGDRQKRTNIHIEMGAAHVELKIPEDAGCRVVSSSLLVIKDLPGFIKQSDGNYETKNFEDANQKVFVDIEGGLANFEVVRY